MIAHNDIAVRYTKTQNAGRTSPSGKLFQMFFWGDRTMFNIMTYGMPIYSPTHSVKKFKKTKDLFCYLFSFYEMIIDFYVYIWINISFTMNKILRFKRFGNKTPQQHGACKKKKKKIWFREIYSR